MRIRWFFPFLLASLAGCREPEVDEAEMAKVRVCVCVCVCAC